MKISSALFAIFFVLVGARSADAQVVWEVDNRFRVIIGQPEQNRFERNFHRYVACASLPWNAKKIPRTCRSTRLHHAAPMNQQVHYNDKPYWIGSRYEEGVNYKTYWLPQQGGYNDEVLKKQRSIIVSLLTAGPRQECVWHVTGKSPQKAGCRGTTISGLDIDQEYSVEARIVQNGKEVAPPNNQAKVIIRDIVIVVLGDSFISGEGNPHSMIIPNSGNATFENGFPSFWWDRRCHRSLLAGPAQAAFRLAKERKDSSVTYLSYACSGSTTAQGILGNYVGLESPEEFRYWGVSDDVSTGENLISQVSAATRDLKSRKIDILVMSTGGNDIGFGAIVRAMLKGCKSLDDCRAKAIQSIKDSQIPVPNGMPGLFAKLEKDLNDTLVPAIAKLAPRHVLVPEYINPTRAKDFCDDRILAGHGGYYEERLSLGALENFLGFGVTQHGSRFAHEEVMLPLNATVKRVAQNNNWTFVDGIMSGQSEPRGYCSLKSWFLVFPQSKGIQGISTTVGAPSGTMHPNIFGHMNIGESLYQQYRKLLAQKVN